MKEEFERQANELEILKLSEDTFQRAARHRREVTAAYDKLREEASQKEKRRRIDDVEKQKIVHRRRQRQWDAFKAEKVAHKEALKLEASESYSRLKTEWEAKSAEQSIKQTNLVQQLLQREEVEGEWKKMHDQLHRRVRERSKQLTAKYKSNGVVISKKEITAHAQHEILAEENEEERRKAENEWLQLEADFLQKLDTEEEERKLAENAEERATRQKSALSIQCTFRMFIAHKLLRQMLREVYVKEFNIEAQGPRYRNTITGKTSTRKPTGLGTEEIEYENCWMIMLDSVLGKLLASAIL
ncbi:hypothetical protein BBJ29_002401 [Phytophthora kernoviae]|uniref:Uncharacterized protein n=1 Tax=Phytophthora kernoviae TaxID=325452 RepID=A0A3F2RRR6_9STRA|nr:hypothetical protein BBJ29_002401 [Phytophthora kernoviae]RLN62913.1 hypothetical protein BBP00_00004443 [Phytophthora kernoviae]